MVESTASKTLNLATERLGGIGELGKEVKGAVKEAAKFKGSGAMKKGKKGSSSGADKAKRAAREIL
jgi:hypothetical protein